MTYSPHFQLIDVGSTTFIRCNDRRALEELILSAKFTDPTKKRIIGEVNTLYSPDTGDVEFEVGMHKWTAVDSQIANFIGMPAPQMNIQPFSVH